MTRTGTSTPKVRQPAEWEIHESCWLAWPSAGDLWQEDLEPARAEFAALCRAITGVDYEGPRPVEKLNVLVPDPANRKLAERALEGLPVTFHDIKFGDIWLRDTAPLFVDDDEGRLGLVRFQFNGWGGKYVLPYDADVSAAIAGIAALKAHAFPWVLEGGSIEVDGEGTCLTSRQCLLNPNRNPDLDQSQVEAGLKQALGVSKILWVGDGLLNDHTDGHIDTIARYVAPGVVASMAPSGTDDPNREVLKEIHDDLAKMTDAKGRRLRVVTIPSPGRVLDEDGEVMAASYVNFYISNRTVVVPNYGTPFDAAAVKAIGALFPGRKAIGLSAKAILTGGGAFHCITQQQPKVKAARE